MYYNSTFVFVTQSSFDSHNAEAGILTDILHIDIRRRRAMPYNAVKGHQLIDRQP